MEFMLQSSGIIMEDKSVSRKGDGLPTAQEKEMILCKSLALCYQEEYPPIA